MKIIKPEVEIISNSDPFQKIELAGRTCYKSESNITPESAKKFYQKLSENHHTAMLEHATFVFELVVQNDVDLFANDLFRRCERCKYLNTTDNAITKRKLVSGNLRAINESGIKELLSALAVYVNPLLVYNTSVEIDENCAAYFSVVSPESFNTFTQSELDNHFYTTMKFVCDRGVTHEIVRHRPFSYAQESTRYVNYSKAQNGGGNIKFIEPSGYEDWHPVDKEKFCEFLQNCENVYNNMTATGFTPQQARAILPNCLKTEIIITGNHKEWKHFFNLRYFGTTGKPHPDMQRVAKLAFDLYTKDEWLRFSM